MVPSLIWKRGIATTIDFLLLAGICGVGAMVGGPSFRGRDLAVVTVAIYAAISVMQALWGRTPGRTRGRKSKRGTAELVGQFYA